MSNIIASLGLSNAIQPVTNYAPHLIIFNFIHAHAISSTRFVGIKHGVDNNVCPRESLEKYGDKAVASGKMTKAQLDSLKRRAAAHANSVENFPFFAVAMAMSALSGVDPVTINRLGLLYTAIRAAYVVAYEQITDRQASYIRSLLWWAGNFTCFRLVWLAGKAVQTGRVL